MHNRARKTLDSVISSMKSGIKVEWTESSFMVPLDGGRLFVSADGAKARIAMTDLQVVKRESRPVVLSCTIFDSRANKKYHTLVKGADAAVIWDLIQAEPPRVL